MNHLEQSLGKALRTKDVAEYLGCNVKTVIEHYQELGGIRLGRQYRFFEKEIINAISKRKEMGSPSEENGSQEDAQKGKSVFDKEGSQELGSHDEAKARRRVVRTDRHRLLD